MLDGKEFGEEIVSIVRGYVEREIGPVKAENAALKERVAALEARPAPEKGDRGEDGANGADGVSPEPEAIAAALLPIAEELIAHEVSKAVAALPPPERGEKGEPGERGEKGEPGFDGANGKDGAGVVDGFLSREGHLIVTLSDGSTRDMGEVVGKDGHDGEPGKDGRDGFNLEDFDCEVVDERTINLKFVHGELSHSYELVFPVPVYKDVYKEGATYSRGDMVTWGGSLWHCDSETKDKPGTESWTLAVKKGRDGKDAKTL
jgi:integrin beta 3